MFTVAVPLEDALALLVARTVTLDGLGIDAGALYSPAAVMVPTAALPPTMLFTLQVTAMLAVLVTVAVNCWVAEGARVRGEGDTVTVIGGGAGGVTVTVADPTADGLCALVAWTVTVAGLGTAAGALYTPEVEIVPTVEFPLTTPLTLQVTPVLVAFLTVAVNVCVALTATDALPGATDTVTAGADVMLKLTAPLVVPPRPVLVTVIGTLVPICAAVAVPVACISVGEVTVEVIAVPPK
jgi:hypothetical protein